LEAGWDSGCRSYDILDCGTYIRASSGALGAACYFLWQWVRSRRHASRTSEIFVGFLGIFAALVPRAMSVESRKLFLKFLWCSIFFCIYVASFFLLFSAAGV
jgi:hypothetical protein